MKKKLFIIIVILFSLGIGYMRYSYVREHSKDISYAVEYYLTTGFFNSYKLYRLNSFNISFSDGTTAIANASGLLQVAPHKKTTYKLLMEKDEDDIWRVSKLTVIPN